VKLKYFFCLVSEIIKNQWFMFNEWSDQWNIDKFNYFEKKLKGMKISAKTIFLSRLKGTFLKGSVFHRELLKDRFNWQFF
jgi:hypothetical protein